MKINKNERFAELFKFNGSQLEELTADALRQSAIAVNWDWSKYLDLPVRDRVTEIEFDPLGFKGLNTRSVRELFEGIRLIDGNYDGIERLTRNHFLGLTVLSMDRDIPTKTIQYKIAPNYLANIKNGQIYNIFDSIERLKYYNFLTDIANKDQNSWKIVTAMDRVTTVSNEKFKEMYFPSESKAGVVSDLSKLNKLEHAYDAYDMKGGKFTNFTNTEDNLPIAEVNKILIENNISLLNTEHTVHSLAWDLYGGKISEQDIINMKHK